MHASQRCILQIRSWWRSLRTAASRRPPNRGSFAKATKRSVLITSIQTRTHLIHIAQITETGTVPPIKCRREQIHTNGTIATVNTPTKFGWLPDMPYLLQEEVDMDTAILTPPSTFRQISQRRTPSRAQMARPSRRRSRTIASTPTPSSVARTRPTPNSITSRTTSLASSRTQLQLKRTGDYRAMYTAVAILR